MRRSRSLLLPSLLLQIKEASQKLPHSRDHLWPGKAIPLASSWMDDHTLCYRLLLMHQPNPMVWCEDIECAFPDSKTWKYGFLKTNLSSIVLDLYFRESIFTPPPIIYLRLITLQASLLITSMLFNCFLSITALIRMYVGSQIKGFMCNVKNMLRSSQNHIDLNVV